MFPCTKCGCCCKRIDKAANNKFIQDLLGISEPFPYSWDESGRCEQLDENNMCKVYENRPLLCNIDKIAEVIEIDLKQWYEINADACNQFMKEDGIDESLRVKI